MWLTSQVANINLKHIVLCTQLQIRDDLGACRIYDGDFLHLVINYFLKSPSS